jgi:hypothetical protein
MDKENSLSKGQIEEYSLSKGQIEEDIWNEQHEIILKQWGEACGCYRLMHNRSFILYKDLNMRFSLPVIVLSTITGTANFAQSTLPENMKAIAPLVIGCFNLVAGLIATVMQFLKVNELMENHRTASLAHGLLSRNIRLMLAIPHNERHPHGLKFVNECKTEFDRLLEQSPYIPKKIMIKFEQTYPSDNIFSKPEILSVRAIPLLTRPKTVEPIEAITKNTPLEQLGKFFSGSKFGTRENEIIQADDDYTSNCASNSDTKKIESKLEKYEKCQANLEKGKDKLEEAEEEDDESWNREIDDDIGNCSNI